MPQCDNPFWRFSLAVYAAPGVASECLALQDTQGVDVNVLLFCAWLGSRRIVLTQDDLATIESAVRSWREAVIRPIRAVRRDIKTRPDAGQDEIAALRKDVAALELRAEQIEQAMLYAMAADLTESTMTAEIAARQNISLLLNRQGTASAAPTERLIVAALAQDPPVNRGETRVCA